MTEAVWSEGLGQRKKRIDFNFVFGRVQQQTLIETLWCAHMCIVGLDCDYRGEIK